MKQLNARQQLDETLNHFRAAIPSFRKALKRLREVTLTVKKIENDLAILKPANGSIEAEIVFLKQKLAFTETRAALLSEATSLWSEIEKNEHNIGTLLELTVGTATVAFGVVGVSRGLGAESREIFGGWLSDEITDLSTKYSIPR